MVNTNVGDMPLDIYSDYITDQLNVEFYLEYFSVIGSQFSIRKHIRFHQGCNQLYFYGNGYLYTDMYNDTITPVIIGAGLNLEGFYGIGDGASGCDY